MSDAPASEPQPMGETVMMPILQAPTRTTLFPDLSAIATAEDGSVEIVFLRREIVAIGQQGRVVEVNENGPMVQVDTFQFQTITTDVGHARMGLDPAFDLALNILTHAKNKMGVSHERILEALRTGGITPK